MARVKVEDINNIKKFNNRASTDPDRDIQVKEAAIRVQQLIKASENSSKKKALLKSPYNKDSIPKVNRDQNKYEEYRKKKSIFDQYQFKIGDKVHNNTTGSDGKIIGIFPFIVLIKTPRGFKEGISKSSFLCGDATIKGGLQFINSSTDLNISFD